MVFFFKKLFCGPKADNDSLRKDNCVIEMLGEKILCHKPNGYIEEITWNELCKIHIEILNGGKSLDDVYWVLHGKGRGCIFPHTARGGMALVKRIKALPHFLFQNYINALESTKSDTFLVWKKTEAFTQETKFSF